MLAVEFKNLIKQIGIPGNWNDLRATYRYNVDEKSYRAFEEEMLNHRRSSGSFEGYVNLISKHIDVFDKDLYVFRIARLLSAEVDTEKSVFYKGNLESRVLLDSPKVNRQQALQNAKRALKKIDVIDIEMSKKRLDIYSSQEFIGNKNFFEKKKEKSAAAIQRIEEVIGFENLLSYIRPTDLIQCCRYPNLGNALAIKIIESGIELNNGQDEKVTIEDRFLDSEEAKKKAEASNGQAKAFKWEVFYAMVKKYDYYKDVDKVLLLANSVFYNKYGDKLDNFTEEEARELKEFTEKIGILLENKKVAIESPRFNRIISYTDIDEWVKTLNKHYIGGKFYTDDEILALANDIVNGRTDVSVLSKEVFDEVMQFTTEEIGYIIESSPESLQFLLENGYIDEKTALEAIDKQEEVLPKELIYAYQQSLLTNEKIAELLDKQVITFEDIYVLKENEVEDKPLDTVVSNKRLIELYFDKDRIQEFEEYRRLYKLLKLEGKSVQEQKENADLLIEESMDLLEEDKMYDLYHMGLIPVDTAIEFVGQGALIKAFASGELKPNDSKRLYDEGVITIQMIREVLKDRGIDDGQKLVLIYSTFPDREDVKTRAKLLDYLNDASDNFKGPTKGQRKKKEPEKNTTFTPQNKFVTDPCSRWKLISALDKEYSQEYLEDGHLITYLSNEEKYIIEKLFDKHRRPAYGAATYILDERTFKENRDKIIQENKINKNELVALRKQESSSVKKIIHSGWGNAILKYFDVKESKKYTKEQCRVIQGLVEEVEESRRPIDERE